MNVMYVAVVANQCCGLCMIAPIGRAQCAFCGCLGLWVAL